MKVVPWKVKVLFALSMMITFYPKRWRGSEPCVNLVTFNFIYAETTYILHLQPCVSYPLNKSNIFTGCYFHTVKIKKNILYSLCEINKRMWRHVMNCIQRTKFERNMFKNERKCNEQNNQCFGHWIWNLFHSLDRIFLIIKILSREINYVSNVKTFPIYSMLCCL